MLEQHPKGVILRIKIIPKASNNAIVAWENGELRVRINAVPEKGQANAELLSFLAKVLKVAKSQVVLLNGDTSRHKRIILVGESGHFHKFDIRYSSSSGA